MAKNKKAPINGSKNLHNTIISQKTFNYNGLRLIADEFKDEKIFVNYDTNKIPYTPNTKKFAKTNDLTTWGSFKDAIKGLKMPNIVGIGIELGKTSKGNLCAIDIDKCIDDKNIIHPKANKIVEFLSTYTEISRSGSGLHLLFYAKKFEENRKINNFDFCEHLETYGKLRYIALTGNIINKKGIENRQKEYIAIYNKYFANSNEENKSNFEAKSINFTNDELAEYGLHFENALAKDVKLKAYWNGKRFSEDESSNDFGFCIKLAYWLKNESLIKKYFIASPYFEQKDNKHKKKCLRRNDYLNRTISCALRRV